MRVADLLLSISFLGPCACSTCESACEELDSCQPAGDCEAACDDTERISETSSCEKQFDDWVDCVNSADDACEETRNNGECVFAENMFQDCLDVYCVRTKDSSACVCSDVSCGSNAPLPAKPVQSEEDG